MSHEMVVNRRQIDVLIAFFFMLYTMKGGDDWKIEVDLIQQ